MNPAFGGFYQSAYVTNDLEQALALFKDIYGVPEFLVMPANYEVGYRGGKGLMNIRLALCNLNGVQIEVIEAGEGCIGLYREGLPESGFAVAHHHVAMLVNGDFNRWKQWRAEVGASDRGIVLEGDMGETAQFIYIDDKRRLGHYTEYLWQTPAGREAMNKMIPTFMTTT
jgi:hypothetical protein